MPLLNALTWLGHAGFRIAWEGKTLCLDPYHLAGRPLPADVVLITHPHFDHWSPEDLRRLVTPRTVLIAPSDCTGNVGHAVRPIRPGERQELFAGASVEAIPAYNLDKPYHPKEKGWVGYILTLGRERLYHAGDTDAIPEMDDLEVDVALLPVGGTYTMTAEEAAAVASRLRAHTVVPMHYGSVVGSLADAKTFQERVAGKEVHLFLAP